MFTKWTDYVEKLPHGQSYSERITSSGHITVSAKINTDGSLEAFPPRGAEKAYPVFLMLDASAGGKISESFQGKYPQKGWELPAGIHKGRAVLWQIFLGLYSKKHLVNGEVKDWEFAEASASLEKAKKWVIEKHKIEPHDERGDMIIVDGRDFCLAGHHQGQLGDLFDLYGFALLEEFFGEEQKAYQEALASEEAAVQYVLQNYRIVAMTEGERKFLHVALKGAYRELTSSDFVHSDEPGVEAYRELSERHKSFETILYTKAPERQELVADYPLFLSIKKEGEIWGTYDHRECSLTKELINEKDAVSIYLRDDEERKNLVCLSSVDRFRGDKSVGIGGGNFFFDGGVVALLRDGDEAFVSLSSSQVIVPLKVGEKKNLVLNVHQEHQSLDEPATMVWGITVSRIETGVVYEPYDNGKLYTCRGYRGSEVSAKTLTP